MDSRPAEHSSICKSPNAPSVPTLSSAAAPSIQRDKKKENVKAARLHACRPALAHAHSPPHLRVLNPNSHALPRGGLHKQRGERAALADLLGALVLGQRERAQQVALGLGDAEAAGDLDLSGVVPVVVVRGGSSGGGGSEARWAARARQRPRHVGRADAVARLGGFADGDHLPGGLVGVGEREAPRARGRGAVAVFGRRRRRRLRGRGRQRLPALLGRRVLGFGGGRRRRRLQQLELG